MCATLCNCIPYPFDPIWVCQFWGAACVGGFLKGRPNWAPFPSHGWSQKHDERVRLSVCFQNGGLPLVQNEGENDFLSQDQQLHRSWNTVEVSVSVWIFVLLLFSWQFPMITCSPDQTGDNLPTSAPPHQGEQDGTFLPSMKWWVVGYRDGLWGVPVHRPWWSFLLTCSIM
jgi:hypothetical protein